jgi:predicted RNase H-like HicB family nuclease
VSGYLLDTNVPSEFSRDRPDPRVVQRLKIQPVATLFLSAVTIRARSFDRTSTQASIGLMTKARYHYNIVLRPEPEGGYTALVPALPGCVTYGRTVVEARAMVKDAISGYIASLRKHKDPIPTDVRIP